jgi:tetratricopeptide (TPR) repeat protein
MARKRKKSAPAPAPACARGPERLRRLLCICLIAVTAAVYWPVATHEFIVFDDDVYVADNPWVQRGLDRAGVAWAFSATRAANWHPLTWLSHMLDVELFGLNPAGHHLTNLLLHLAAAVTLFCALAAMTRAPWAGGFVAALFALHPLHVESVAWVAERKDLLSGLFWMLTIWAYARYAHDRAAAPGEEGARAGRGSYRLVLVFFALGLLSKPMLVTLPFVLLLLDYWPLGRLDLDRWRTQAPPLIFEKIPLFALSAASCTVTFLVQQGAAAVRPLEILPLEARLANALVSYVAYIGKMLWPENLAVYYPYDRALPLWQTAGAGLLLLAISLAVFYCGKKRPYLPVGWLWYLGTLVPVIGLVQVGGQAMADRYTYVPLAGLFIAAAAGAAEAAARRRVPAAAMAAAAAAVLAAFIAVTEGQLSHWRDSIRLFRHTLAKAGDSALVHNNLAVAFDRRGRIEEALHHYRQTLRFASVEIVWDAAISHYNIGNALIRLGKPEEAIAAFIEALRINPAHAEAHNGWGLALKQQGENLAAIEHYREALRRNPDYAEAHTNLAVALEQEGRAGAAIDHYRETVRLKPGYALGHFNLGAALHRKGLLEEAGGHYAEALGIKPDYAEAHNNLGAVLLGQGRLDAAIARFAEAVRINPDHAGAFNNLGHAFARQGRWREAQAHFGEAVRVRPDYAEAYKNLGSVLSQAGNPRAALPHYLKALELDPAAADVRFMLGAAYSALGEREAAMKEHELLKGTRPELAERLSAHMAGLQTRTTVGH